MSNQSSQLSTIVVEPKDEDLKDLQLEVHFNLWNSDKNDIHCLDIGLMCPIRESKYSIELKIPGCSSHVENLIEDIKKDQVACNVFNELVRVTSVVNQYVLFTKEKTNKSFLVFDGDINCETGNKGKRTLITLDVEKNNYQPSITDLYFRIRIPNFDIKAISACDKSLSRFFVPYCEKSVVYDFRLNDTKLLSVAEGKKLQEKKIVFSKIHFLLIGDINETAQLNNGPIKIRVFENHNWDNYISKVHPIDKPMIAYHMTKKDDSSASFLLKLQANKTNAFRLTLYTIAVILLSLVANIVYNLICFYCHG